MAKKSEVSPAALGALTNQGGLSQDLNQKGIESFPNPLNVVSDKMKNSVESDPQFTGVSRSMICVKNQGFNNFQICTLYIEKGKVIKMEKSDMWQSFEAFAFLELISKISCDHLNNTFEEGKAFTK